MTSTTLQGTIHVEQNITVHRPAEELYRFWRDFRNLPRILRHLQEVTVLDDRCSHWVTKALAGFTVDWDAEMINEVENELIAWQSIGQTSVPNAGSVRFIPAGDGESTEVKVTLNYDPPAGKIGDAIARLFGESPDQQVRDDLRTFKQLMEGGDVVSSEDETGGKPV